MSMLCRISIWLNCLDSPQTKQIGNSSPLLLWIVPGGDQRIANIELLLEKAGAFQNTSFYGLFHFIRYLETIQEQEVDFGEANILDENADVVRIMTIHKSKGLLVSAT